MAQANALAQEKAHGAMKREISPESFIFPALFIGFFALFSVNMGLANTINTLMNTSYSLLIDTVLYLTAICVIMGAVSALFSEFGLVSLVNRALSPLMRPLYGLPGAASLGVVTTFLSDNPAILTLADDEYFRHFFKKYQLPALTNLGTSFGMGLIVCTYMLSLPGHAGYAQGVLVGLLGAVVGSIVSTRLMLVFTARVFGKSAYDVTSADFDSSCAHLRPVRSGNAASRALDAILDGGKSGVRMGVSIVPGVLVICSIVMMLTNGPSASGAYTGAAYEGVAILPALADKISFILGPLFGFSSAQAISVPVTALGAAGAAITLVGSLSASGLTTANDIAVFTAMCMCWSGYLSTHVCMMNALNCNHLTGKAILSHTIGGLVAGVAAHWLYVLFQLF